MKKTNIITTTYEHGKFLVDITFDPETGMRGVWIHRKDFGAKNLMFEMVESEDRFLEIVSANLTWYESLYDIEYN